MKVLYIGPYRDGTGWAHAAIENILALDAAGVEVVPRPLKLNNVDGQVPARLIELEKESDKGCEAVIQNCLPHQTDFNGHFGRNIAYYFTETSHFRNTAWAERLNCMDECWVPCRSVMNASIRSNVCRPIFISPVPCDVTKYQKKYEKLNMPHLEGKFVFYTIGEVHRRKNLVALLKAFHLEFDPSEDVSLLIKGTVPGASPAETEKNIVEICNTVKQQLKLYKSMETYHSETILSQYLTDEQMMSIHQTCNCYVSPSYGEGWNMPAFDAMAMGKTPICSAEGGPLDFLEWFDPVYNADAMPIGSVGNRAGWLVDGQHEPVFGMKENTFHDLYVGNEDWFAINVSYLRAAMREAFSDAEKREQLATNGVRRAYDYSYLQIGNLMKSILEGDDRSAFDGSKSKVWNSQEISYAKT